MQRNKRSRSRDRADYFQARGLMGGNTKGEEVIYLKKKKKEMY